MTNRFAFALGLMLSTGCVAGAEAHVAVAANFAVPARPLADAFGEQTVHKLTLSSGSTGKFYAQIKSGAPFDVFLSADEETPRRLEAEQLAVPGSRFTYAVGRLVLWAPRAGTVDEHVLRAQKFNRIAIANPRLAPYGMAAKETLDKLGLWEALRPKLVQGENIAQTYQFVSTGNAELGLVALSQVRDERGYWLVPERLHAPLRQDAVLLKRGEENPAARAFLDYLKTAAARERIRSHGYQ